MRSILKIVFVLCLLGFGGHAYGQFTQFRYENGKVSSEGMMRNGKPDGYWKTYYPDGGMKSEGNRLNLKLDSTWNFYREDSTLERSINYREDMRNGPEKLYSVKGILQEEFINENSIKNGEARYYYDSGELKKIVSFINNKEEGKATEFDRDGRTITQLNYRNGFIYSEERINRYDSGNKRTGIWRDLYPDGLIKEDGNWANGLRNGVFKFFNKKGELEKLEKYEDGVLVIDEASTAILDIREEFYENGKVKNSGPYRLGKKQGNFREYDSNGNQIGGALYDNDVKMGEGMIDSLGRRIGPWKLFHPQGDLRSEGDYIQGLKDGPWVYYFEEGRKEQQGSYREDLPNGQWQWYFTDGSMHRDEYYKRGKEDGHAIEYDTLGAVINEGDYVDGKKSGSWHLTVNDHHEVGEYQDGERNGVWTWTYGNGKKSFQGEFQAGIPIGKHKYWYESGQSKMNGEYQGGEMQDRWDYYDETGLIILQIEYEAGSVVRINGKKIKLPERREGE